MNTASVFIIALLAATVVDSVAVLRADDSSVDNEVNQVRAIEKMRLQALVDGKIDVAKHYHADDFQLISPGGMTFTRDEYLDAIGSGKLRYFDFEPVSAIKVRLHGNAAVIRYRSSMLMAWEGKKGHPFRCWHTDLYEKRDGQWQIVWSQVTGYWYADSDTAKPPDEPPESTPASVTPAPGASVTPENTTSRERLVIVSATEFRLQGKDLTAVAELEVQLKALAKRSPKLPLLVIGADQSHFGVAIMVVDACRKAGLTDIKIDGAPEH